MIDESDPRVAAWEDLKRALTLFGAWRCASCGCVWRAGKLPPKRVPPCPSCGERDTFEAGEDGWVFDRHGEISSPLHAWEHPHRGPAPWPWKKPLRVIPEALFDLASSVTMTIPLRDTPWPAPVEQMPCPQCHRSWRTTVGSRLACHAKCLYTPESIRVIVRAWESTLHTEQQIADALGITSSSLRGVLQAGGINKRR